MKERLHFSFSILSTNYLLVTNTPIIIITIIALAFSILLNKHVMMRKC